MRYHAYTKRTMSRLIPAKHVLVLSLLICAVLLGSLSPHTSHAGQGLQLAQVHQVHDGDTVTLRLGGKKYRTRLIGMDAPEMGQRPWGRNAKEHLIKIMRRAKWTVYVETDEERIDKYGRLLVYLWTKKRRFINEMMVVDGYAVAFTIPPNTRYADRFTRAENSAREKQKGIWGPNGLKESPVEYRKKHPRE